MIVLFVFEGVSLMVSVLLGVVASEGVSLMVGISLRVTTSVRHFLDFLHLLPDYSSPVITPLPKTKEPCFLISLLPII